MISKPQTLIAANLNGVTVYGICVLIYDTAHNEYLVKLNLTVNISTC